MQKQFNREVLHHEKAAAIRNPADFFKNVFAEREGKSILLANLHCWSVLHRKNWILCILAQWYMQEWYFFWYLTAMNPEEIDSILLRLQAGVDLAMQRAKAWSKYMKEITTYIEKKTQLGK